jgi:hypothetical protein
MQIKRFLEDDERHAKLGEGAGDEDMIRLFRDR